MNISGKKESSIIGATIFGKGNQEIGIKLKLELKEKGYINNKILCKKKT
jgi:hypothetical protein